jgi:hypothetical protein
MTITHDWDNEEKTVYLVEMAGSDWTWPQFSEKIQEAYKILEEDGRRVHVIMWFKTIPTSGDAISNLRMGGIQPKNVRHTVMINNTGRFFEMITQNVVRSRGWVGPKIVSTLEDARAYLIEKDQEE